MAFPTNVNDQVHPVTPSTDTEVVRHAADTMADAAATEKLGSPTNSPVGSPCGPNGSCGPGEPSELGRVGTGNIVGVAAGRMGTGNIAGAAAQVAPSTDTEVVQHGTDTMADAAGAEKVVSAGYTDQLGS